MFQILTCSAVMYSTNVNLVPYRSSLTRRALRQLWKGVRKDKKRKDDDRGLSCLKPLQCYELKSQEESNNLRVKSVYVMKQGKASSSISRKEYRSYSIIHIQINCGSSGAHPPLPLSFLSLLLIFCAGENKI